MTFTVHDFIGSIGVGITLLTYFLLQLERLKSDSLAYSVGNALGAGMVLYSLHYSFNLSAFIVETVWVLISIYGIGKAILKSRS